jgi:hypothetical protein
MTEATSISAPADVGPYVRRSPLALLAPVLIVGTFAVGYAVLIGWPTWPVADAAERIAYWAILAGLLAAVASLVRSWWLLVLIDLAAAVACALPTLAPKANLDWNTAGVALATAAAAIVVAVLAFLTRSLAHRRGGTLLGWLVLLGMAASAGALLLSTGSLKLGQAGFALAGGVAIALILGLFVKPVGRSAGAATATLAIIVGLLISGHLWSELPIYAAACVLVAPVLACIIWKLPPLARRPVWQAVIIAIVIAAIPATAVTVVHALKAQKASASSDEYSE